MPDRHAATSFGAGRSADGAPTPPVKTPRGQAAPRPEVFSHTETAPAASRSVPTEKQYALLLMMGSGSAWLSAGKRKCEPLLRRGWVEGEWRPPYYQFVRLTPAGFEALARAVAKYGLPEFGSSARYRAEVCSECGRDWRPACRCGSKMWRYEEREVEVAAA